ncbi:MAG: hypothetical protein ABI655_04695 [Phenylobacterium sp.]
MGLERPARAAEVRPVGLHPRQVVLGPGRRIAPDAHHQDLRQPALGHQGVQAPREDRHVLAVGQVEDVAARIGRIAPGLVDRQAPPERTVSRAELLLVEQAGLQVAVAARRPVGGLGCGAGRHQAREDHHPGQEAASGRHGTVSSISRA